MKQQHGRTARSGITTTTTSSQPDPDGAIGRVQAGLTDERELAVRQTAYALYEARGHVDGHELDDWLKAETQVQQTLPDSA